MSFSVALPRRFSSIQMDLAFENPSRSGLAVLVGPPGSGKSTLINAAAAMEVTLAPM